jgi:WW domain
MFCSTHFALGRCTAVASRSYCLLLQVPAPVQSAWQMHHAPDGRPYWANTQSGVTQWEPPAS